MIFMGKACKAKLLKPDPGVETQELVTVVPSACCNVHKMICARANLLGENIKAVKNSVEINKRIDKNSYPDMPISCHQNAGKATIYRLQTSNKCYENVAIFKYIGKK
jgi:hypothetical protein